MPCKGRDAGEVAAGEREMVLMVEGGAYQRLEFKRSTPTNDVLPDPVIHGEPPHVEPPHVEPTHVEPIHIDEEINGDIHANESISAVIPNDAAADLLPRLLLFEQFPEEMLQEIMHEELSRNGVIQHQICAQTSSRHYLVVEHMTRHD
ncbi:hypothetical protein QFC24_006804 [Naganishia onofrii]|uniref:Uncharacterized protein n=1 Tax=Naganishia onofrii TaxID=1851511 RepID=A0ACC2WWQ7_9TREE|nr:hypothetical protein QFC24_006804 [Naganishia onofrii]